MPWTERDRSIMGDVYRIMQKFVDVPTDEAKGEVYWSLLAATLNEFVTKWGMDHLTVNAAVFVSAWLQDVYKAKRDAANRIEAAAVQYRDLADYGATNSHKQNDSCKAEAEQTEPNAQSKCNPQEKALIHSPLMSFPCKSSPNGTDGLTGAENKEKSTINQKEAETNIEYSSSDPRVRDGMLCFL